MLVQGGQQVKVDWAAGSYATTTFADLWALDVWRVSKVAAPPASAVAAGPTAAAATVAAPAAPPPALRLRWTALTLKPAPTSTLSPPAQAQPQSRGAGQAQGRGQAQGQQGQDLGLSGHAAVWMGSAESGRPLLLLGARDTGPSDDVVELDLAGMDGKDRAVTASSVCVAKAAPGDVDAPDGTSKLEQQKGKGGKQGQKAREKQDEEAKAQAGLKPSARETFAVFAAAPDAAAAAASTATAAGGVGVGAEEAKGALGGVVVVGGRGAEGPAEDMWLYEHVATSTTTSPPVGRWTLLGAAPPRCAGAGLSVVSRATTSTSGVVGVLLGGTDTAAPASDLLSTSTSLSAAAFARLYADEAEALVPAGEHPPMRDDVAGDVADDIVSDPAAAAIPGEGPEGQAGFAVQGRALGAAEAARLSGEEERLRRCRACGGVRGWATLATAATGAAPTPDPTAAASAASAASDPAAAASALTTSQHPLVQRIALVAAPISPSLEGNGAASAQAAHAPVDASSVFLVFGGLSAEPEGGVDGTFRVRFSAADSAA